MTEPILQVENLKTYYYSKKTTIAAVDGVDFSLEKGSVLGIVGESGCGKSSILNLINKNSKTNLTIQLDINSQLVLDYIQTEKKTFQEIADHTKFTAKELNAILIDLEMQELVVKFANNSYIKA